MPFPFRLYTFSKQFDGRYILNINMQNAKDRIFGSVFEKEIEKMKKGILLHEADDDVGVTAMDLTAGEVVLAVTLEGETVTEITLAEDVPLSHKVAMRAMETQKHIIEYGRQIG